MASRVADKGCELPFPASVGEGLGDFFDQWFDDLLGSMKEPMESVEVSEEPTSRLKTTEETLKDLSLLENPSSTSLEPSDELWGSWKPIRGYPATMTSIPKSRKLVQRLRMGGRSISSSDLLAIEGKTQAAAVSSRLGEQLPNTPPYTPHSSHLQSGTSRITDQKQHCTEPQPSANSQDSLSSWLSGSEGARHAFKDAPPSPPLSAKVQHAMGYLAYFQEIGGPGSMSTHPSPSLPSSSVLATSMHQSLYTSTYALADTFGWFESPGADLHPSAPQDCDPNMLHINPAASHLPFHHDTGMETHSIFGPDLAAAGPMAHCPPLENQFCLLPDHLQANLDDCGALEHRRVPDDDARSDCSDERTTHRPRGRTAASSSRATSSKPAKSRSRSQRLRRTHRSSKSLSKAALAEGGTPPSFVNFTSSDSQKILTGVAPSGSSKTKARREREASELRRKFSEAAARAVRQAGGDIEELQRQGLFEAMTM